MTETSDKIRSAADHLDDARTSLDYGNLEASSGEIERIVTRIDGQIEEMEALLREVAVLAETEEGEHG